MIYITLMTISSYYPSARGERDASMIPSLCIQLNISAAGRVYPKGVSRRFCVYLVGLRR